MDVEDLQWPVIFLLVSLAIALIYYYAPDCEQQWMWITPGSIVATTLWVITSLGFKLYVTWFASYNATYGAIGGVIVLMTWFYVSSLAILVGAELNAEIEHASPYGKDSGEKAPGDKERFAIPPIPPVLPVLPNLPIQPIVPGNCDVDADLLPAVHVSTAGAPGASKY